MDAILAGLRQNRVLQILIGLGSALVLLLLILSLYWSGEPEPFDVREYAIETAQRHDQELVRGYTTTTTLIHIAETLLDKPGGFLSNDIAPPGLWLDNIPNWEFGVLVQVRDMARALRKDFSRSQSQSQEDPDLAVGEPRFHFDTESWMFPPSESEYRNGIRALTRYRDRLANPNNSDAQFYTRADNLRTWLADVETRLGSLSQRLSASVGQRRLNTDLAGARGAEQATPRPEELEVKTPWTEIDDVFYEARGTTWALMHLLRAIEIDFASTLENKNALVSLRQIIRELEGAQAAVHSPVILNGGGFGLFANHSLVMGSYVARANAGIIDLRELLAQG